MEPKSKSEPDPAALPAPVERLLALLRRQQDRLDAHQDVLAAMQAEIDRLSTAAQQHQDQLARITVVLGELQQQIDGLLGLRPPGLN